MAYDSSGARGRGAGDVLGGPLQLCSEAPLTGYYRDGCCHTGPEDLGRHVVCAVMTEAFLQFSSAVGNDLQTPRPEFAFPGLRPGDRWCLCADRWREADEAAAPLRWYWRRRTKMPWPALIGPGSWHSRWMRRPRVRRA